jgi:hypothetical protein
MVELFEPSLTEQIAEAERELKMRQNVYPRQVSTGRLSQSLANRQIERMSAIIKSLRRLDQIDLGKRRAEEPRE